MTFSVRVVDNTVTQVLMGRVDGMIQTEEHVGVGWSYDGTNFAEPAPVPVPLEEQREGAVLPRTKFCQQLWRLNILPQVEAIQAARGEWPETFDSFASALAGDEAADAMIEWAGATEIHYNHALLQALALSYASGDQAAATALLDQIYGIS